MQEKLKLVQQHIEEMGTDERTLQMELDEAPRAVIRHPSRQNELQPEAARQSVASVLGRYGVATDLGDASQAN